MPGLTQHGPLGHWATSRQTLTPCLPPPQELIGETAGKLHTGRSRNDQVLLALLPTPCAFPIMGGLGGRFGVRQWSGSPAKQPICLPECCLLLCTGGHRPQAVDATELL